MAIEIERKFLVTSDGWRDAAHAVIEMAQGYLNDVGALESGSQKASVRVRLEGESARLNIKSCELGHSRQEFEYPLPPADARQLLALCVGGLVHKRRHLVQVGLHLWEVDEFLELGPPDEAFAKPVWAGAEVTDQPRYYNLALADHPYSQWTAAERG
mgnify:CR=1 FL=1